MLKKCFVCQATKIKPSLSHWIEEKHYQSSANTCKEIFIGIHNPPNNAAQYGRQYIGSIFYCSIACMEKQLDKEEQEDLAKGNCSECQQPIVVINQACSNEKHQQEAYYIPINLRRKETSW